MIQKCIAAEALDWIKMIIIIVAFRPVNDDGRTRHSACDWSLQWQSCLEENFHLPDFKLVNFQRGKCFFVTNSQKSTADKQIHLLHWIPF